METACDSSTVKGDVQGRQTSYANTILSMFAGRRRSGLVLGMALKNSTKHRGKKDKGNIHEEKNKKQCEDSQLFAGSGNAGWRALPQRASL
jgi:hypothetical protein